MARIFISYRRQDPDEGLARRFDQALNAAGHEVFLDSKITWGTSWARAVREAIERADFLLLLLSREAAGSEMVTEEVTMAREIGHCRILPLRLELPFREPLPYLLSAQLRQIQQQEWRGEADTARVIELVLETVKGGGLDGTGASTEFASGPFMHDGPAPLCDPRELPGGAISVDARHYVLREADAEVATTLGLRRPLVTIRGPRQSGKTSLMLRAHQAYRQGDARRSAFVDMQTFEGRDFASLDAVWLAICDAVATGLGVRGWRQRTWDPDGRFLANVTRFFDEIVIHDKESHMLVCLDEVDRVFHAAVKNEFFASLRALFNAGAQDTTWTRVAWVLATSSEPSFFVDDLSQSPFNIGLRIPLDGFTEPQIEDLARRYGLSPAEADPFRIHAYLGGQPYLVHRLVTILARRQLPPSEIFDPERAARTTFREHLMRFLLQFQREETLARAMKGVLAGRGCSDVRLADRLESAGLVRSDHSGSVVPASQLYASFFGASL